MTRMRILRARNSPLEHFCSAQECGREGKKKNSISQRMREQWLRLCSCFESLVIQQAIRFIVFPFLPVEKLVSALCLSLQPYGFHYNNYDYCPLLIRATYCALVSLDVFLARRCSTLQERGRVLSDENP